MWEETGEVWSPQGLPGIPKIGEIINECKLRDILQTYKPIEVFTYQLNRKLTTYYTKSIIITY